MIKQIVKSEAELIDLITDELSSNEKSNNTHGDNTKEEITDYINYFLKRNAPKEYPAFIFAEFTFIYNRSNEYNTSKVTLINSFISLNKEELSNYINEL